MSKKFVKVFTPITIGFLLYLFYMPEKSAGYNSIPRHTNSTLLIAGYFIIWFIIYVLFFFKEGDADFNQNPNLGNSSVKEGFNNKGIAPNGVSPEVKSSSKVLNPKRDKIIEINKELEKIKLAPYNVNYDVDSRFLLSARNEKYPLVIPPSKGCKIIDSRISKETVVKGFTEEAFVSKLNRTFGSKVYKESCFDVPGTKLGRLYTADATIRYKAVAIVIEIDEPYSGTTRRPTHYINSYDVDRNAFFTQNGWIVVRFAEEQIFKESEKCIYFLADLISSIYPGLKFNCSANLWPGYISQWTIDEAERMAIERFREEYLGVEFKVQEKEDKGIIEYDLNSTRIEKPQTKLTEDTKFEARNAGIEKVNNNPPIYTDQFSSAIRPVISSAGAIKNKVSAKSPLGRLPQDAIKKPESEQTPQSVENIIEEAISSNKFLRISYERVLGIVKPIRISDEDGVKYLYGSEVLFGVIRKFLIESIEKSKLLVLDKISIKCGEDAEWSIKKRYLQKAIDNNYVATIVYSKDGINKANHNLHEIKSSVQYNNCINAYSDQGYSKLTFSIRKIADIEVFPITAWLISSSHFGLNENYAKPQPKPDPKPRPVHNSAKQASNSGCMVLFVIGVGGISLLFLLF